MSAKIPCGKLLTFAGAASIMRFRRHPCGAGGSFFALGRQTNREEGVFYFRSFFNREMPRSMASVLLTLWEEQYASNVDLLSSLMRMLILCGLGLSVGRPILAADTMFFTSCFCLAKVS